MPWIRRGLAVAGLGLGAAAAWRWLRPERVAVDGESMSPALLPGDRLLLLRRRVRRGDVVAFAHPRLPGITAVKRVAGVPGDRVDSVARSALDAGDGYVLLGDNPAASTDSRQFGAVPSAALRGRAVYRYAPPGRRGRLRTETGVSARRRR
jgi:signal peptidase I